MNAWLCTILRNLYFSQYRKRKREVPDTDGVHSNKIVVAPAQTAHMEMLDLRVALARLPDKQREALLLVGGTLLRRGRGNLRLRDRHDQEPRQSCAEVIGWHAVHRAGPRHV
jgi:DNA-directed RNA polymerase specialized sigma24 family protein